MMLLDMKVTETRLGDAPAWCVEATASTPALYYYSEREAYEAAACMGLGDLRNRIERGEFDIRKGFSMEIVWNRAAPELSDSHRRVLAAVYDTAATDQAKAAAWAWLATLSEAQIEHVMVFASDGSLIARWAEADVTFDDTTDLYWVEIDNRCMQGQVSPAFAELITGVKS